MNLNPRDLIVISPNAIANRHIMPYRLIRRMRNMQRYCTNQLLTENITLFSKTLLFDPIARVRHYNVPARILTELVNRISGFR